jgi:hypothetical protein
MSTSLFLNSSIPPSSLSPPNYFLCSSAQPLDRRRSLLSLPLGGCKELLEVAGVGRSHDGAPSSSRDSARRHDQA